MSLKACPGIGWPRLLGLLKQAIVKDLCSYYCRSYGINTYFAIRLLANGVVNTAHDLFYIKNFFGDLTRHNVAVIAISDSYKCICIFNAGANQDVFVNAIAHIGFTTKIRTQALECITALVEHRYAVS